MTIGEQAVLAASYLRMPKRKLAGQALENFMLAEQLNDVNQKQSAKISELIDKLRVATTPNMTSPTQRSKE